MRPTLWHAYIKPLAPSPPTTVATDPPARSPGAATTPRLPSSSDSLAGANQPKPVAKMSPQTGVVMVTTAFSGVSTSHDYQRGCQRWRVLVGGQWCLLRLARPSDAVCGQSVQLVRSIGSTQYRGPGRDLSQYRNTTSAEGPMAQESPPPQSTRPANVTSTFSEAFPPPAPGTPGTTSGPATGPTRR